MSPTVPIERKRRDKAYAISSHELLDRLDVADELEHGLVLREQARARRRIPLSNAHSARGHIRHGVGEGEDALCGGNGVADVRSFEIVEGNDDAEESREHAVPLALCIRRV